MALASAREALQASEAASEAEVAQLKQLLQEKQEMIANTVAGGVFFFFFNYLIFIHATRNGFATRSMGRSRKAVE